MQPASPSAKDFTREGFWLLDKIIWLPAALPSPSYCPALPKVCVFHPIWSHSRLPGLTGINSPLGCELRDLAGGCRAPHTLCLTHRYLATVPAPRDGMGCLSPQPGLGMDWMRLIGFTSSDVQSLCPVCGATGGVGFQALPLQKRCSRSAASL